MREGWNKVPLGQIVKFSSGKTKPDQVANAPLNGTSIPVFGGNGILGWAAEANADGQNIIIGRVGAHCGCVHFHDGPCWITDNALYSKEFLSDVDRSFLTYLLELIDLAQFRAAGGQPLVSQGPIHSHVTALPPLPEQRKIAEILRSWDEAIDACERLIEQKKRFIAAVRQQVFGRDGVPPQKWPSAKLSDLVRRVQRQADGEDHPVMTISGKFGFRRQDEKFARFMAGDSVGRYLLLERGEFAYNKGNSKTFPQGCIYRLELDTALVPFVYFAFALSDSLDCEFYAHLFASGFLNRQLGRLINSGVRNDGLLNIYAEDFFGCEVPVPPRAVQKQIGELFGLLNSELQGLNRRLEQLRRQKRGLMQKLLTGEWRVDV